MFEVVKTCNLFEMTRLGCDKRSLSPSGERCLGRFDGPGSQFCHKKDLLDISLGAKLHAREVEVLTSS